jgi:hypothetical protein
MHRVSIWFGKPQLERNHKLGDCNAASKLEKRVKHIVQRLVAY